MPIPGAVGSVGRPPWPREWHCRLMPIWRPSIPPAPRCPVAARSAPARPPYSLAAAKLGFLIKKEGARKMASLAEAAGAAMAEWGRERPAVAGWAFGLSGSRGTTCSLGAATGCGLALGPL